MAKSAITHIPIEGGSGRIRTGAMEFENDWPGLFIRGDDCIALLGELKELKKIAGHHWGGSFFPFKCDRIIEIISEDVIVRR